MNTFFRLNIAHRIKLFFVIVFISGAIVSIPFSTSAAALFTGKDISVSGETMLEDDVYGAGKSISLVGNVSGDAIFIGESVESSGVIGSDALFLGTSVSAAGSIWDDVRMAGADVTFNGDAGDDVLLLGLHVATGENSRVGGDLLVRGSDVTLRGLIQGAVHLGADTVLIDGIVDGNLEINAEHIVIGQHAVINGDLNYRSERAAIFEEGSLIHGSVRFSEKRDMPREHRLLALLMVGILCAIAVYLLTLIVHGLFRRISIVWMLEILDGFWGNVLKGLGLFFAVPIAAILLSLTIVGIPFALLLLALYASLLIISPFFTVMVIGSFLTQKLGGAGLYHSTWKTILLGAIAVAFLHFIPILGHLILCVVTMASFGGITHYLFTSFKARR